MEARKYVGVLIDTLCFCCCYCLQLSDDDDNDEEEGERGASRDEEFDTAVLGAEGRGFIWEFGDEGTSQDCSAEILGADVVYVVCLSDSRR